MTPSGRPRLSLILPTRNRKDLFAAVLETVFRDKRDHPDLEIIVVDGGSTDGTVEVIRAHEGDLAWHGTSDGGIYAALNLGLRHATGEYVRMVSDDDEYVTGCLPYFADYAREHPEYLAIGGMGGFVQVDVEGNERDVDMGFHPGEITMDSYIHADSLVLCVHEALFFRRDALEAVGGWDTRFNVSADIDVMFRLLRYGGKMMILPRTVMIARRGVTSISQKHFILARVEPLISLILAGQWRIFGKCLRVIMRKHLF